MWHELKSHKKEKYCVINRHKHKVKIGSIYVLILIESHLNKPIPEGVHYVITEPTCIYTCVLYGKES